MKAIENIRIKVTDMSARVKITNNFKISKKNGTILFEVNGTCFNPPRRGHYSNMTINHACTLFNVKVLDKSNKLIYTYCINLKHNAIVVENFGKSNNEQMEEYILKEVKENVLINKLNLKKSKCEVFFDTFEDCYYMN